MNAAKILQSAGLELSANVFSISNEEVMEKILEFIKEWKLRIKIKQINKDNLETLFSSYADAIITYHPENNHQERVVFLRNKKMLKKYGLTDEDILRLDFS